MFYAFNFSAVVFILLINVKMATIAGTNANNCWHFNIYEHDECHAQLS